MRCDVLNCRENNDGYCSCESYVSIGSDGTCSQMFITLEEKEEDAACLPEQC